MKLRTKIILAFSFIAIISVSIIGLAGIAIGKSSLEKDAFSKLVVIRELKANRIEDYFSQIRNQLLSYSEDFMVIEAMEHFQDAFNGIENLNISEAEIDKSLNAYYSTQFLPKLDLNSIKKNKIADYYPVNIKTKYLQYLYISNNTHPSGEKDLLMKSNDNSKYSTIHAKYHPVFKNFLEKFGYYDMFLIDTNGHVVYSVFKEVDFATSILKDAYKETNLAQVVKGVFSASKQDYIKMVDFGVYPPSYNENSAFMASPIYNGNQKIGALVFQLPSDRINNIMTDNQQWEKVGMGKSGETYLVGEDLLLRNQSRFLIEDKSSYLKMLKNIGVSKDTINQINNLNNSIGLQHASTKGVNKALKGDTGVDIFVDYRGVDVLSSYKPLGIKDVNWVIMSEIDKEEAFSIVDDYIKEVLFWIIILIIIIPLIALYFSLGITKPLIKLTNISKKMAAGNLDVETGLCRSDEIGTLACSFDTMSSSIKQMMDELEEANTTLEDKVTSRTKEVEESHHKIKSIINNANDAIITIDENQKILQFNPSASKIFGYETDEILGESLLKILPDNAKRNHHQHLDEFKSSSSFSRNMDKRPDAAGKRKNGEIFPIEASISKQMINGHLQFTAFVRDITVRKKLELKIEEANQRMEDELNVGKEIQMSMLPLIFPAFPDHSEFNIFALLESAREVGGDFYDFYFIEENKFLFTIADVSGKGVPSALFMAVCKTLIKSRANEDNSPSSIVTFVNDELSRDNKASMFVTLFLCIIDLTTGELKYTNAGHNPPHLMRVNGDIETLDTLHGPVVGAIEDFVYKEDSLKMHANDVVMLFTDGVNEAMNSKKELYTDNRLIENINNSKGDPIIDSVKGLYNSVMEFQGEAEQADDITILAFEYLEPILSKVIYTKELSLNNELLEIDRLNDIFNKLCEEYEIPALIYRKFNIVFDELINNIVSYGYNDDNTHKIKVSINITNDQIVVSLEDDAIAFNPLKLAAPKIDASVEEREIGGLGIHMIKKLMDNVSYKRYIKKNLTTLYKKYK